MNVFTIGDEMNLGPRDAVLVLREDGEAVRQEVYIPAPGAYPDDMIIYNTPLQLLAVAARSTRAPFRALIEDVVARELETQTEVEKEMYTSMDMSEAGEK